MTYACFYVAETHKTLAEPTHLNPKSQITMLTMFTFHTLIALLIPVSMILHF